jgi:hypothetical protein
MIWFVSLLPQTRWKHNLAKTSSPDTIFKDYNDMFVRSIATLRRSKEEVAAITTLFDKAALVDPIVGVEGEIPQGKEILAMTINRLLEEELVSFINGREAKYYTLWPSFSINEDEDTYGVDEEENPFLAWTGVFFKAYSLEGALLRLHFYSRQQEAETKPTFLLVALDDYYFSGVEYVNDTAKTISQDFLEDLINTFTPDREGLQGDRICMVSFPDLIKVE